jgi:curved DNA-binding protein CbpA
MRDPYEILQLHRNAVPEVIEAAYRALARLRHPDRTDEPDAVNAMSDLNWAYAVLREPELRASYDGAQEQVPIEVTPTPASSPSLYERVAEATEAAIERDTSNPANTVLDFGRYAGMTLRQIARVEPSYLEWLRRHSSGLRYRNQIDHVLGKLSAASAAPQPSSG